MINYNPLFMFSKISGYFQTLKYSVCNALKNVRTAQQKNSGKKSKKNSGKNK